MIDYKYNEKEFMKEAKNHIDTTYENHYSGGVQVVEYIMSNAETLDYLKGNIIKYIHRYGKKHGYNDEDLYKAIHYITMMAKYADNMKLEEKLDNGADARTTIAFTNYMAEAVSVTMDKCKKK
tara:strand:+ start:9924 stop:10292 length:369 start_codon:yes stop_codon:yes gene_type:complete